MFFIFYFYYFYIYLLLSIPITDIIWAHIRNFSDYYLVRELEDLIIDCIYSGLIVGRLDQRKALLEIRYCRGRDINEKAIGLMKNRLLSWLQSTDQIIEQLKKQQKQADYLTEQREQRYIAAQIKIEKTRHEILEKAQVEQAAKGGGGHD